MIDLLKAFVDIALWRKGPQHLPTSVVLLLIVAVIDAVLTFMFVRVVEPAEQHPQLYAALQTVFGLGWIWLLLALFRRSERFVQTATAIFATSVLLTPMLLGTRAMLGSIEQTNMLVVPMTLGLLTVSVWYLLINAHIVRAALEVGLFVAILLTLLSAGCVEIIVKRVLTLATSVA